MAPLGSRVKSIIDRTSNEYVEAEIPRLLLNWENNRWLSESNVYKKNPIKQLNKDYSKGRVKSQYQLCEYITCSMIIHCLDGWSYLGRAISADLHGDPNSARHMAYYAELRAAMSLLASEGIGVFQNKHAILTGNSRSECFSSNSTHEFVWDAFDYWVNKPKAKTLLFEVIEPGGVNLNEWLSHFSGGTAFIAQQWMKQWGLDLKRFKEDRTNRNTASYRPSFYNKHEVNNVRETVNKALELWSLSEPINSFSFIKIDNYLLKYALEVLFKSEYGRTVKQSSKIYRNKVEMMFRNVDPLDMAVERWKEFLLNHTLPQFIIDANSSDDISNPRHSKQVISRAFMLLRLSNGAVKKHIKSGPLIDRNNCEFWVKEYGNERGMWDNDDEPEFFTDMWEDVNEAIINLKKFKENDNASYYKLWQYYSNSAHHMGITERIGLWGIGI